MPNSLETQNAAVHFMAIFGKVNTVAS